MSGISMREASYQARSLLGGVAPILRVGTVPGFRPTCRIYLRRGCGDNGGQRVLASGQDWAECLAHLALELKREAHRGVGYVRVSPGVDR